MKVDVQRVVKEEKRTISYLGLKFIGKRSLRHTGSDEIHASSDKVLATTLPDFMRRPYRTRDVDGSKAKRLWQVKHSQRKSSRHV